MTPGQRWALALVIICAVCATGVNWQQDERMTKLQHRIERQQLQLDSQRDQIQQLNRKVFDLERTT